MQSWGGKAASSVGSSLAQTGLSFLSVLLGVDERRRQNGPRCPLRNRHVRTSSGSLGVVVVSGSAVGLCRAGTGGACFFPAALCSSSFFFSSCGGMPPANWA